MMRYLIIFLFVVVSSAASAQVRLKLNYDKLWQLTFPDSAVYIRVCIYDTTNAFFAGPVSDLYLSGKPQMTGKYVAKKKEGEFVFYYEDGQTESKGPFENDIRAGVWTYYYPDGRLKQEVEFIPGGAPRVMTFNDADGAPLIRNGTGTWKEFLEFTDGQTISITGEYKNYLKEGHWKYIGPGPRNGLDEWYKKGEFIRGRPTADNSTWVQPTYYPRDYSLPLPTKFLSTEKFAAHTVLMLDTYPALGQVTVNRTIKKKRAKANNTSHDKVYVDVDEQPNPVEGLGAMVKFIGRNLQYPADARRKGIQGNVFVEFIVDPNGRLSDFRVLKGISPDLDEEALRVVELMSEELPWEPGAVNGTPVTVRFVLPIKFVLDDKRRR